MKKVAKLITDLSTYYQIRKTNLRSTVCGFRKGYSSQNCLLAMLENFKKSADDGNEFGALLTDRSKAFDCIDHKLLITKLFCYGV